MKKEVCRAVLLVSVLTFCGIYPVQAAGKNMAQEMNLAAVANAKSAVEEARSAIQQGKDLVKKLERNKVLINEVKQVLQSAAKSWSEALKALESAKTTVAGISSASGQTQANKLKMLAELDARVAEACAKLVRTDMYFVEAAAAGRTQSLSIIRDAIADAEAAAAQVRFNREQVKSLLAGK